MAIAFPRNLRFLLHAGEDLRDESFYHVRLVEVGAVPVQSDASAFGGQAVSFSGSFGNYLAFADPLNTAGNLPAGPFYIYARFKLDGTTGAHQAIIGRAAAAGNQAWYIVVHFDLGAVSFWSTVAGSATGGTQAVTGSYAFNTTDWYTVEVSRDASNVIRVFVNGAVVASATYATIYNSTTQQTLIGRIGVSGYEYPFNGLIDEIALVTGESVEEAAHSVRTTPFDDPVLNATAGEQLDGRVFGPDRLAAAPARPGRDAASNDLTHGGVHKLTGHVSIDSTPTDMPVARRVLLLDERDNRVIRQTWSRASDGYYEFLWILGGRRYSVLAYDHTNNYRVVGADNRLPEPM
ncbi:LamG-like jellyroll fold domain-containing protein [Ideonella sp.]|uniref:LamG-like jellyroll fold domain-containing protein n=1 Tax=Ideonella sp. TaxID=1929293 RepID=UPI003BB69BA3